MFLKSIDLNMTVVYVLASSYFILVKLFVLNKTQFLLLN